MSTPNQFPKYKLDDINFSLIIISFRLHKSIFSMRLITIIIKIILDIGRAKKNQMVYMLYIDTKSKIKKPFKLV